LLDFILRSERSWATDECTDNASDEYTQEDGTHNSPRIVGGDSCRVVCGLVVGRASYGVGVYCGGGATRATGGAAISTKLDNEQCMKRR
jgi:hypothetical protein